MIAGLAALYRRHYAFALILPLFAGFRLLAILLFRPGGFITDFSDYDFYYTWGTLVPMGYAAYDNLWTAYPPLFPALMLPIFEWSSRIPAWIEPRLLFHVLFGAVLLIFECGNFILIYRLGNKLGNAAGNEPATAYPGDSHDCHPEPRARSLSSQSKMLRTAQHDKLPHTWDTPLVAGAWPAELAASLRPGLLPALFYALLFVPVYTLIGWFEPMPLFFMLLGLDLLLGAWRWGWIASSIAAGLGFLTKLTPALLLPVAVRWLGAKLNLRAVRQEGFNRASPGNLGKAAAYVAIFFATVIGVGYPFVRANPALAFSSFRIQSIRPPWQSIWALFDSFYGYGLVPLDMRNLDGLAGPLWESRLPWTWIGLAFAALYLWLYTRPYDWRQARTPIAFSGAGVILLFLYSKGWSPQFLLWVLVFIALLLPTLRGVLLALLLSLVNFVEADIFLILLPDEHWIMAATVLIRTALLVLLAVEFLGQIWPAPAGVRMRRVAATLTWAVMLITVALVPVAIPRTAQAYQDRRLAEHPCREAIVYLRQQAPQPGDAILTQQTEVWRDLYPWLREEYKFRVLDGYSPDRPPEDVVLDRLHDLPAGEFWWVERSDAPFSGTSPAGVRERFFALPNVHLIEEITFGACTLFRGVRLGDEPPLGVAQVQGGPIRLVYLASTPGKVGEPLYVVLYWLNDAPVAASYTVFTQVVGEISGLAAQQDNLPVEGLAPTTAWQPGVLIRDPFRLDIPEALAPGDYLLWVGLYDEAGNRAPVLLPDGTMADHLSFPLRVDDD